MLTGVLDNKSDWWSLGMIVLEAASGRHPFDGLTEQVMNHQLATRPVDVRGVYDDALRVLCRGLLLRDPARRFGGEEVARWLAGERRSRPPRSAKASATSVRPYRFGKTEATSAAELALALARHWDDAKRDLPRGHVARWLENELHDHNLLRALQDIQDRRGSARTASSCASCSRRRPIFRRCGRHDRSGEESVIAAARVATKGDVPSRRLARLARARRRARELCGSGRTKRCGALDRRWREGWEAFAAHLA